jgi:hypothetical protein
MVKRGRYRDGYFGKLFPGVSSYSKEYFRLYARMKRKDPAYMEAKRIYNRKWMKNARRRSKKSIQEKHSGSLAVD